jgi:hypothetical protein
MIKRKIMKADLMQVVGDLLAMGYRPSDIAKALGKTRARIGQIRRIIGMQPKPLILADLPHDMQERINALTNENDRSAQFADMP